MRKVVDITDWSKALGCSVKSIRRMILRTRCGYGNFPLPFTIGGSRKLYWLASDIDYYLEIQAETARAVAGGATSPTVDLGDQVTGNSEQTSSIGCAGQRQSER